MTNYLEIRNGLIHADCGNGNDYTLCGLTAECVLDSIDEYDPERESDSVPRLLRTSKKITCPQCASIIRYCHKIPLSAIGKEIDP